MHFGIFIIGLTFGLLFLGICNAVIAVYVARIIMNA